MQTVPDELEVLLVAPLDHVRLVVPVLPGAVGVDVGVDAGARRQRHLGGGRRGGGGGGAEGGGVSDGGGGKGGRGGRDGRRCLCTCTDVG